MTSDHFALIRTILLGLTGLACLAYALGVLALGRPDPVGWYWPATIGGGAGLLIVLAALLAGRERAGQATDDLYVHVHTRAATLGYWLSLVTLALTGAAGGMGWIGWDTAFAAQGTLTGAAFLLAFVVLDLRHR